MNSLGLSFFILKQSHCEDPRRMNTKVQACKTPRIGAVTTVIIAFVKRRNSCVCARAPVCVHTRVCVCVCMCVNPKLLIYPSPSFFSDNHEFVFYVCKSVSVL